MSLQLQVSPHVAVLGSLFLSFVFVASLHIWKLAGYKDLNRDEAGTIQRRFLSAILSCLCSVMLIRALSSTVPEGMPGLSLAELLGLRCAFVTTASVNCVLLTASLFLGPLVQHWFTVSQGESKFLFSVEAGFWVLTRNLILAPITEELVFRACLVRLWVSASFPLRTIIFCSPFCFALAHTHHFIEHVRRTKSKKTALLQVLFQVFYTSLFGIYSNFLLIRTGSLIAVILAHTFCNHQGFPDITFLISSTEWLHEHRKWLGGVYVCGILAFACLAGPLTAGFPSTFVSK
ncbi:unnamed protein product [Durusdinium trenchii]|uniref:intramembrane prenyl-peptidase Rce1 n=2 Tax=Durusdinium trenchii TaxID=1381693 RepID=A0ABP0HKN6_9DINO